MNNLIAITGCNVTLSPHAQQVVKIPVAEPVEIFSLMRGKLPT